MSAAPTLAPTQRAAEATRPQASRGWLPGAVLILGLAAAFLVVGRAQGVSVKALGLIHGESSQLHQVGGMYVADWNSPLYNPFVENRFRILTLLATLVYLVSVTAVGATLIGAVRGVDRWPRAVRALAGFLPGYLIVLAPIQVLFAWMPYRSAAWTTLIALPVIAILLQRRALLTTAHGLRHDPQYRRRWLGAAAAVLGILLVCGVHRLQAGRNFMVPDSITAFLDTAGQQLRGVFGSHLAQWDQQSDEWIFNAPLMFTSAHAQDFLFPIYATEFVGLASFGALIFGLVHSVARRRALLCASLATGAVVAASPAIYPWYEISLFGGQNPAMWLGLPGREIGIVAPWVALLLLGQPLSWRAKVTILLATAGLGFNTVSGTVYVAAALGGAGIWQLLRGRAPVPERTRTLGRTVVVTALGIAALATPLYVYWQLHRTASPNGLGWILAGGGILAVGAAALLALLSPRHAATTTRARPVAVAVSIAALLAALGAGFILSNNLVSKLFDGQIRDALSTVLPGYGIPVESRNIVAGVPAGAHFPTFTGQECQFTGHCVSFGYFVAGYGVLLVLALATWLALAQRTAGEDDGPRRAAWLVVAGAFACSLALVDFTGIDRTTAWVLTRFIEIPYYALLAFAALALAGSRSRITATVGTIVIGAWVLIPLATTHVAPQIVRNARYLIGVLH
jgi:hypothetical protein